jgi:hypothetical protein
MPLYVPNEHLEKCHGAREKRTDALAYMTISYGHQSRAEVTVSGQGLKRVFGRACYRADVHAPGPSKQALQKSDKRELSSIVFASTIGGWLIE